MEPLAAAGYVMIASAAVVALLLGALGGAIARALGRGLPWVALLAAAGYLASTVLFDSARLAPAAIVGIPPLLLTLLTCWLSGHHLEAGAGWRRIPAALAGLGCALLVGFLWGFTFRIGVRTAVSTALALDAVLIVWFGAVLHRRRRSLAAPAGAGRGR